MWSGCLVPEEDVCLYHVPQAQKALQNPRCSIEHQCAALGDPCSPQGPLEAAAEAGWRGGPSPCHGGSRDSGFGVAGGLRTPALLPGASEVLAAPLMASSAQGSAKCAFWLETGKGKKGHGFSFFFFLSCFCLSVRENCSFPAAGSQRWAEVPTGAGVVQHGWQHLGRRAAREGFTDISPL